MRGEDNIAVGRIMPCSWDWGGPYLIWEIYPRLMEHYQNHGYKFELPFTSGNFIHDAYYAGLYARLAIAHRNRTSDPSHYQQSIEDYVHFRSWRLP